MRDRASEEDRGLADGSDARDFEWFVFFEEILRMKRDATGIKQLRVFGTPCLEYAICQRRVGATRNELETHLASDRDHRRTIFHDELEVRVGLRKDDRHGTDSAANVDHNRVLRQLVPREPWRMFSTSLPQP